ncbi:MAG TPA: dTDP-4-dehydrorhamnose 3,5-epimerase [Candidatus Cloacimonadota bacterium]|nr:dTDP-4-dehydrorhamnose 3,5-epimerase [Candidatus Cloacimonadota bacterium]HPT71941.1 dTDP-4-dehydrorhamnose 3,5-epimerase [Candidatus Cloacimonadota bacterium]
MKIVEMSLAGVFRIELDPRTDDRGFFVRTYDRQIFKDHGLSTDWQQESHAYSKQKGIIRGLHLQLPPFTETKLVMVIKGAILDAFVDVRPESPTYGKWDSILLTESNYHCLYLPRGFAHSYCTLEDNCDVVYKMDNIYNPQFEAGIIWNDPNIAIQWPVSNPVVSAKDLKLPTFEEFKKQYAALNFNF